tara:strand:- start:1227 stop:2735 length:1509 start_codon:yes stop_codon:yes gene_type:complete
MAYTVNKTNNSASPNQYTVQDGVVNSQTDLSFIGKGYAGYGESIAENFLHLLENFSNSSAPTKPIQGQLWWDSTNSKLKVYTGSSWQNSGGSAPYQATAPSGLAQGDLWIDSDTGQLYLYNGVSSVLVGPPGATGTTNGFTYDTILDSTDANQNITKLFNDGNLIAIISEDTFTPKSSITGFATIKKGITLTTAIADTKFQGTATDADALGGIAAANYLRSNANDTTSGTLSVANDGGVIVGADSDLTLTVDAGGAIISNTVANTDISFKVNDGGTTTTVMTIDGSNARVGIGTATPTQALDVNGTIKATSIEAATAGNVTGNLTGNITSTGANTMGTLVMGGTLTSKAILPDATTTYDIGSSSKKYNTVYAKATSAQYADLAEIYESDAEYEVGTVVIFGGEKEITVSSMGADPRVAGVISENPAYLMNSEATGQAVALQGKVPCKVVGVINKGDMLVTHSQHPGVARKGNDPKVGTVIGKALEEYNSTEIGAINIVAGRQ